MTKTPEELAEKHVEKLWQDTGTEFERMCCEQDFLAGYQAAKEYSHAALEEAQVRMQELRDQLMEESGGRLKLFKDDADAKAAYQEALEDTDSCDHIVDVSKMVDVSSSVPLNNWISVKNRLPEAGERVLAYVPATEGDCDHWIDDFQQQGKWQMHGYSPTHWMPLLEPPEE